MAKYRIKLTQEEVLELRSIIKKGSHTSQTYKAAYIDKLSHVSVHKTLKKTNLSLGK